jgi:UPF0755 protein
MRKITLIALIFLALLAGFFAYSFFRPAVQPGDRDGQYLYINSGDDMSAVRENLIGQHYISGSGFNLVVSLLRYNKVRPGRFKIKKGMSLFNLVRMLKNGRQTPVKMVIIKERTKELFAGKFGRGKRYDSETDSLQIISFLQNSDSLNKYGLDTNTVMATVIPLTYELNWNSTPSRIFRQFHTAYKNFWNDTRLNKCQALGLNTIEVTTLASIVEEETNLKADKYNIASTYLNRIRLGMKLQADPTVKFALKDFGIKRVLRNHLQAESPFNTYLHAGLPPGPICTPSQQSVDAVLEAPKTDYVYFVASDKMDGSSIFTINYEDHLKYAKLYQQALNNRMDSINKARAH